MMLIEQFEERGLAHYSYAVGCRETGQIAIIDPRFDVDVYLDYAEREGLVISHVFETHIHADYASGARYLASRAGATLGLSAYDRGEKYEVDFPHRACFDGDTFQLGQLTLKILHTPGHTPEHLSFLVVKDGKPEALFSGDFLLVGSLGRPDLIGKEETLSLAKALYQSMKEKLLPLPNSTLVYPSHGAGSFCGGGMAARPFTTIGQERLTNPLLRPNITEKEFIDLITVRTPFRPDYFSYMKEYNSSGSRKQLVSSIPLEVEDFRKKWEKEATIIDVRDQHAFSAGHIPGSICIGGGEKVGFWASMVVPYDQPLLIVTEDPLTVPEVFASLSRVGLTQVEGYLKGGIRVWTEQGGPLETIGEVTIDSMEEGCVIDVRSDEEWAAGHLAHATHIPCGELKNKIKILPEGKLIFICAGGYRSIFAASFAKKLGRKSVAHLPGGILAWQGAGLSLGF